MASAAIIALHWTGVILRHLPEIIKLGHELYSLFCSIRGKHNDKQAVVKSMKLLNRHQDDIDRVLQDPQQKQELLNGLTILMRRINESNGNNNALPQGAYGCNTTSSGGKDCGASFSSKSSSGGSDCGSSFPSKSSFKGARWMECDVCRSDYDTTTKRPLILNCGHTFCRECVEALARRGLIKCPNCRTSEMRSIAAIPTNSVLMPVLEDRGSQSDDDSCCGKGSGTGSCSNGDSDGGCDSVTLSFEQQLQFAIFLSKQDAQVQGQAEVERRWQEVEEEDDRLLAEALQMSEMYEASRLCAERNQAASASGIFDQPKKESCAEQGLCGAPSSDPAENEDVDNDALFAYKLQQEEIAKMKRLCGNSSNDWNKEMHSFFGPSLCGMDEDGNLRQEENAMNGREQDDDDGATCCRRMEDGDEDGATCHRRSDVDEDEVTCNGRDERDGGKKCSYSDDENDDLKKCSGDGSDEEERKKKCLALAQKGEELLIEMAIQLSLQHPQPSDPENK